MSHQFSIYKVPRFTEKNCSTITWDHYSCNEKRLTYERSLSSTKGEKNTLKMISSNHHLQCMMTDQIMGEESHGIGGSFGILPWFFRTSICNILNII